MALKYLYVPSGYKAGTAYGVLPNVANADLDFVRGTTATRINADGLIETMGANVPRLDYTDGLCPTLLTEPESTNLVTYSEDLTQWTKSNSTVTENATLDPKGTNNGFLVSLDTSSSYLNKTADFSAEPTTFSVYLKSPTVAGTYPLNWYASNGGGHHRELVNVTTEWQRFELNFTPTGLGTRFVYIGDNRGGLGESLSSVYAWGAQVESSSKATSYIKTEASIETRSADTGVISGDLSSYINSSEGVLEIKAKALFNGGSDVRLGISDGTSDNRIALIYGTGANSMTLFMKANGQQVLDGGTVDFKTLTGSFPQTDITTFKIKWKSGDIQVKVNDTTIALSQTDTFTMVGLDQVRLDGGAGSNLFEGNIQYIKVYDSATDF